MLLDAMKPASSGPGGGTEVAVETVGCIGMILLPSPDVFDLIDAALNIASTQSSSARVKLGTRSASQWISFVAPGEPDLFVLVSDVRHASRGMPWLFTLAGGEAPGFSLHLCE